MSTNQSSGDPLQIALAIFNAAEATEEPGEPNYPPPRDNPGLEPVQPPEPEEEPEEPALEEGDMEVEEPDEPPLPSQNEMRIAVTNALNYLNDFTYSGSDLHESQVASFPDPRQRAIVNIENWRDEFVYALSQGHIEDDTYQEALHANNPEIRGALILDFDGPEFVPSGQVVTPLSTPASASARVPGGMFR